jgi:hypothetical protein
MAEDAMMPIRNARFNQFGSIDCEVQVRGEWVPFTASEGDSEAFGRQVYAAAASDSTTAAYVAPEPEPEPTVAELLAIERADMVVSRFQAKAALLAVDKLDDAETAVAASSVIVKLAWAEAVEFRRNSPTIISLSSALSLSATDLDTLFRTAALIDA